MHQLYVVPLWITQKRLCCHKIPLVVFKVITKRGFPVLRLLFFFSWQKLYAPKNKSSKSSDRKLTVIVALNTVFWLQLSVELPPRSRFVFVELVISCRIVEDDIPSPSPSWRNGKRQECRSNISLSAHLTHRGGWGEIRQKLPKNEAQMREKEQAIQDCENALRTNASTNFIPHFFPD